MAAKLLLTAVLGSLALCALADDAAPHKPKGRILNKIADKVAEGTAAAMDFMNDPEDVGSMGKRSKRSIPVAGMEELEFAAKNVVGNAIDNDSNLLQETLNLEKDDNAEFDFNRWKQQTKGDSDSSLQTVASRNADLQQLVDYNRRYRKYGEDAEEDKLDFEVVRQGFGKAAAASFEGVLLLAKTLEAQDADQDGRLTKDQFVAAVRALPADAKEERVRKAAKLGKDPEGLFELLRVDDAELLDIGAFVEGVSHAITPRGVAGMRTAQEQSEAAAKGGVTAEQVMEFVQKRTENADKEQQKMDEVIEKMQQNPHVKEFQSQVDDVTTELSRQVNGFAQQVSDGDALNLAQEVGDSISKEAGKYSDAISASGPEVQSPKVPGQNVLSDLKKEIDNYKGIRDEAQKQERERAREYKRAQEEMAKENEAHPTAKPQPRRFKVKVNGEEYNMVGSSRNFYKDVDMVMKKTGVDHKTAAQALAEAEGVVENAIDELQGGDIREAGEAPDNDTEGDKEDTVENLKKIAEKTWHNLKQRASKQKNQKK